MWTVLFLTLYRLLSPFLLYLFPPLTALTGYLIGESFDWYLFPIKLYDYSGYQSWDKYMDGWFMLVATVYAMKRWQETTAKKILAVLFTYRLIGTILFEITANRSILVLFPNLFDMFFIFYHLYQYHYPLPLFTTRTKIGLTLAALLFPKLMQEYFIHGIDRMPWQIPLLSLNFFSSNLLNQTSTQATWMLALIAIPLITFRHLTTHPT
jgi:hypothetical protein